MPIPSFWQIIGDRYKAGLSHQFLLYFNINDIIWDDVYGYLFTIDYLMERMNQLGCDAVLYYNRSEGVLFPSLGMRSAYQSVMKLARIEEIEPIPEELPQVKAINSGLRHVGEEKMTRDPQEAMALLERFFRQGMGNLKVGLLIDGIEKLAPNRRIIQVPDQKIIDLETLQRWASDLQMKFRGHIVLLLTENPANVAPELLLSDGFATFPVEIPMPTYQERLAYVRHLLYIPETEDEQGKYKLDLPEGMLSEEFADMTYGLNLMDIQNLWITSKARKTPVSYTMVVQQNRESIRKRSYGLLELIFGEHGIDTVGGLSDVITYMANVIQAMKNWDTKSVPMGILLVGPPGTGKTNLIYALARDMGIHFVRLRCLFKSDPITRGDWDFYRVLDVIRSLIPVVVFIDEIDKFVPAGVDEHERKLTSQFMDDLFRFMNDRSLRGKVLWVTASNRPDLIRPEFRKRGRSDDVIPFLLPDIAAREDILRKIISRNAIPYDVNINFPAIAARTDRCTGADLEVIVMRGFQNARLSNRDTVIDQDLIKAADEFIHTTDPNMDEYMMLLALKEASLSPLVPRQLYGTLQDKVYENGRISKARINQRILELETQLHIGSKR